MRRALALSMMMVTAGAALAMAPAAAAKLTVVATTPDLGALVRLIAGDLATVTTLAEATEDPHFVDPRPSFLVALSRADALVVNGLELETGWLPPLLVNARNPKIQPGSAGYLDASGMIARRLGVPSGRVDRTMGDVHPSGNPHYSSSPSALAEVAPRLAERLGALWPEQAGAFAARGREVKKRLDALAATWRTKFSVLSQDKRQVVVYHESYLYLLDWLQLTPVAVIEDRPGIKPSPAHVASVLKQMRDKGVKVILQEEWHADATSKTLARLAGGTVIALPGGARADQGLEQHLDALAAKIHDALR